jgi:predicted Rossmann fold nucleotide-binding protein DprA/Smf involved in DNA uptake
MILRYILSIPLSIAYGRDVWGNFAGEHAEAGRFPWRNRLLSGLSVATLVIESINGSNTLSTTRFAFEQSSEILCLSVMI